MTLSRKPAAGFPFIAALTAALGALALAPVNAAAVEVAAAGSGVTATAPLPSRPAVPAAPKLASSPPPVHVEAPPVRTAALPLGSTAGSTPSASVAGAATEVVSGMSHAVAKTVSGEGSTAAGAQKKVAQVISSAPQSPLPAPGIATPSPQIPSLPAEQPAISALPLRNTATAGSPAPPHPVPVTEAGTATPHTVAQGVSGALSTGAAAQTTVAKAIGLRAGVVAAALPPAAAREGQRGSSQTRAGTVPSGPGGGGSGGLGPAALLGFKATGAVRPGASLTEQASWGAQAASGPVLGLASLAGLAANARQHDRQGRASFSPAGSALTARAGVPSRASSGGDELFGLRLPPEAGQAIMVMLIVFASMLLLTLLFADELQLAPRYRRLLARLAHRPRI